MIYCFDLDSTLCTTVKNKHGHKEYKLAEPLLERIKKVNELYDDGHIIKIDTARGAESGIDWTELTKQQLAQWGVKYHLLRLGKKLNADQYIDDKGLSDKQFFND